MSISIVYIAAPYPMRAEANAAREYLAVDGIQCSSRWITDDQSAVLGHEWAQADLDDLTIAHALITLNPLEWGDRGTGGRHVELGFALARHMPIFLIGARTNIFHYHHAVIMCADLAEVRQLLHD